MYYVWMSWESIARSVTLIFSNHLVWLVFTLWTAQDSQLYCGNVAAAKAQRMFWVNDVYIIAKILTLALPLIETRGFTREMVDTSVTVTVLLDLGAGPRRV
ncbi:hypothetical protein DFH29DRAFT_932408 [Suillus ampliporus]|nr:hypothetical protein DFH29DRAFT_932408 [Suillus ampliporus]